MLIRAGTAQTPEEFYAELQQEEHPWSWWLNENSGRLTGVSLWVPWRRYQDYQTDREWPSGYPVRLCANGCGRRVWIGYRVNPRSGTYWVTAFCGDTCRKQWFFRRRPSRVTV